LPFGGLLRLSLTAVNWEAFELLIDVGVRPEADAGELDEATLQLRRELLELDVEDVKRPSAGPPPPGTRAVDAGLVGSLVVTASRELVGAVVRAVAGWLARRPDRSVKLAIGDDSIEVTDPSAEEQRRLIEAFLARHAPASA
jgi:Effector Associated Constant Component 1